MKGNGRGRPRLTLRRARTAALILVQAVPAFALLSIVWKWFLVCAALALMGLAAVYLGCFRCPACGRYLNGGWGEYCPYCGETLLDDEE